MKVEKIVPELKPLMWPLRDFSPYHAFIYEGIPYVVIERNSTNRGANVTLECLKLINGGGFQRVSFDANGDLVRKIRIEGITYSEMSTPACRARF